MAALADLQPTLEKVVDEKGLPGASAAVLADGEVTEAAAGVLNVRTGVEATPDSLFQIGSITKVYTATLTMQLVDAGLVDLDAPVRTYLPAFAVADAGASASITVRHLLTHTSGFDGGDFFHDSGRGDDTLDRYVGALSGLAQISAPGARWSYNNAGFGVLGRIVEVVTGEVWDDALRTRLLEPAGLTHSATLPEDLPLFRVAAGHQAGTEGKPELVKRWGLDRSAGPAGLICASAADVVGFARVHLDDGRGLVSPASVRAMQEPQITMPGETSVHFGLGWLLRDLECDNGDRLRTIGHNGGTLGQAAFLTVVPERGIAISLLTNGPTGGLVWQDLMEHVASSLGLPSFKLQLPSLPDPGPALDLDRYVGRYERKAVHTTIDRSDDGDGLVMSVEYVDVPYDLPTPPPMPIAPVDEETFVIVGADGAVAGTVQFLDRDADGRPQLFFSARLARRASR